MNLSGNFLSRSAGPAGTAASGAADGSQRTKLLSGVLLLAVLAAAGLFWFTSTSEEDLALPPLPLAPTGPGVPGAEAVEPTPTKPAEKLARLGARNPFVGTINMGPPTGPPTTTAVPVPPVTFPPLPPEEQPVAPEPTPEPTATEDIVEIAVTIEEVDELNTFVRMTINGSVETATTGQVIQDLFQVAALREGNCVDFKDGAGDTASMCEGDFRTFYFYRDRR